MSPSMADLSDRAESAPLKGVRVFDMTQVIAGPHCTMLLASLGAEVVKIERPDGGDSLRSVGRYEGREEHDDYFNANNHSKKSICLNLKDSRDRAVAYEMVKHADVVVENYAAGTADKLGVGWKDLSAVNGRLVYCSISGFGQEGPYRHRLALDPIIQAISGIMSVTGEHDGAPMQVGAPLADVIAGIYGTSVILGALYDARSSGVGRYIDVSMQDAMISALGPRMGEGLQAGVNPSRIGNENPMRVPANSYRTADGEYLVIIVQNDRYWPALCRATGREDLLEESRFGSMTGRVKHRRELNRVFSELFASRPAAYWMERLEKERVPFALVNDYIRALSDPQIEYRGSIKTVQHPVSGSIRVIGAPWIISGREIPVKAPPTLGQHTDEVLRSWLDWSTEEIQQYHRETSSSE